LFCVVEKKTTKLFAHILENFVKAL